MVKAVLFLVLSCACFLVLACLAFAEGAPFPVGALVRESLPLIRHVRGLKNFCGQDDVHLPEELEVWEEYVETLCRRVRENKERAQQVRHNGTIVIVGGGPAGLLTALTAHRAGATQVVVVEKRRLYNRSVWFDISNSAWGPSRQRLDLWGISSVSRFLEVLEFASFAPGTAFAISCRMLEKFLATSCLLLGIEVRYGREYQGMQWKEQSESMEVMFCVNGNCSMQETLSNASVVVAADGVHSAVSKHMGIGPLSVGHTGAQQKSLFVSFKTEPLFKVEDRLDDWEPLMHAEHGIVRAFLRFFNGQYDVQLLLSGNASAQPLHSFDFPREENWAFLFGACSKIFPGAFPTEQALKENVMRYKTFVAKLKHAQRQTVCLRSDCRAVGLVVGDAVFPAHYRLGIGVNNCVDSMRSMQLFLRKLLAAPSAAAWKDLVTEKETQADAVRRDTVWKYQADIMYLETVCGYRVVQYYDEKKGTQQQQAQTLEKDETNYAESRDAERFFAVYTEKTQKGQELKAVKLAEALKMCENERQQK